MKEKLILASGSPRRRELLEQIGFPFEVITSDAKEVYHSEQPDEIVKELSLLKAKAVAESIASLGDSETGVVLGADTVVVRDGEILGKPVDETDAFRMLSSLQGRMHQVYTGVAVLSCSKDGIKIVDQHAEETKVFVHEMTEKEIQDYVDTKEPLDKAGSYGIQGSFAAFIDKIEGDYFNVVGLPVAHVYQILKQFYFS